ncbi:SGNH/GDSL hydrolase family protein [Sporolactobacillus shoreae]|uniref:SGNH/GDSL hydrolase family protein n=1 Tax=Sporolactobacillus shoreae TaxID=1465501 RepID=UPI001F4F8116|nr:SGNH/GDSL hydrolase family protein [Sporolactobacillus shoreae]
MTYSYRIVALGDSLTQGVGDPKNHGYVGMTADALKKQKNVKQVSFEDLGHLGDTSADLLNVLKKPQARETIRHSNTIFLTIGGNDIVHVLKNHFMDLSTSDFNAEQKVFSAHLETVFSEIRKLNPDAPIYYFGLYNPFEDYLGTANKDFVPILNSWNANSKKIASRYRNTTFIPTFDIFKGRGSTLLYADHFHPNEKGYSQLSSRLMTAIRKNQ